MVEISEKNFEETIESLLLAGGPDSLIQGEASSTSLSPKSGKNSRKASPAMRASTS
jgi:hypothetical protein